MQRTYVINALVSFSCNIRFYKFILTGSTLFLLIPFSQIPSHKRHIRSSSLCLSSLVPSPPLGQPAAAGTHCRSHRHPLPAAAPTPGSGAAAASRRHPLRAPTAVATGTCNSRRYTARTCTALRRCPSCRAPPRPRQSPPCRAPQFRVVGVQVDI